jgi:hypothetical protein
MPSPGKRVNPFISGATGTSRTGRAPAPIIDLLVWALEYAEHYEALTAVLPDGF